MKPSLLDYIRLAGLFIHLKLLNLHSRLPPLTGGVLDEQIALMHRGQELLGEVPLDTLSPKRAREDFRRTFGLLKMAGGTYAQVDSVRDLTIPSPGGTIPSLGQTGINARLYLPGKENAYPLFVFLHGGGWVVGGLESADNMARFICKHAGCAVISVDYRLAPEHAFPAAVGRCLHGSDLGGRARRGTGR